MALDLRTGSYGEYYGNDFNTSNSLTTQQMQKNAIYIFNYLSHEGWSINAICGLLGNMQSESALNPGRWQSDSPGNLNSGYGLTQWTPATNLINWVYSTYGESADPSEMDNNLARIIYELENHLQYYQTSSYPLSFSEFSTSNQTPYYLACAFAWNYERSYVVLYGTEEEKEALRQQRGGNANSWKTFFETQADYIANLAPFINTKFWITAEFGEYPSGGSHNGLDIATPPPRK